MLWDSGSTLSFVTFVKAKEMKLKGKPVKLGIVVVGGQSETIESQIFKLSILKQDGKVVNIEAYEIFAN